MQLQHSELIKVTLYWAKQFLALANVRYLFCVTAWFLALCGIPKEAAQQGGWSETELGVNSSEILVSRYDVMFLVPTGREEGVRVISRSLWRWGVQAGA